MFKANQKHLQVNLFGYDQYLPEKQQKELQKSEEQAFYELIFRHIDEHEFACMYSQKSSRPNAPVNCLVAALIIIQKNNWTYEHFFKQMTFNVLTRTALGLSTFGENPFNKATLFNFQNAVAEHYQQTGVNLLENVFNGLTASQLKELQVKTSIQRTDSFLAASNIVDYSRVQLLVEVLIRLYRELDAADQARWEGRFATYTSQTAGKFVYQLCREDIPHTLKDIGGLYQFVIKHLADRYGDLEAFRLLKRVYAEQFNETGGDVNIKPGKSVGSNSLQSPDDPEATYRKKRGQGSKGYSVNLTETAHPDNQLNLVTDITVQSNNTDDSVILNQRITGLKDKTPDLEELHADGAYGSTANDHALAKEGVSLIQTAIRGRVASKPVCIKKIAEGRYLVSCAHQSVESTETGKRHQVCFDLQICDCLKGKYYFSDDDYLKNQRHRRFAQLPEDRRTLRANVEATVKEFKLRLRQGKLKVRGRFKAEVYAYSTGMAVNFGRIYRHITSNHDKTPIGALKVLQGTVITGQKTVELVVKMKKTIWTFHSCLSRPFYSHFREICF